MIYAYDLNIQYPVKDLYDNLIIAMSIAAAKDMYEKGQLEIKDFLKAYGDFLSPIAADMDWYSKNVTGKVRDTINYLYANGIDPIRSAEGRAAVSRVINSMPVGDIAKIRLSAETAKEYLKSFDDTTNPELERFLGRDLSNWSTLGDPANGITANGVWGTNKASKYQDLNQYTSHIFDALKDSYIGTDKNHYDWYGVTNQHLYESLTPDKIGGLLNTPLGQFHYQNAIRDLAAKGITNPTEQLAIELFKQNVVAANHEKVHQDRKINEIWKMQQEDRSRMRAARASRPEQLTQNNQWSFAELVRRSGTTAILGKQVQEYSDNMVGQQRDHQIDFGLKVSKATGNHSLTSKGIEMYKQQYGQNIYRKKDIVNYLRNMGYKTTADGGSVIIPKSDLKKLSSLQTLVSRTTGFRNKNVKTSTDALKNADVIVYTPTEGSYQAFMKNSRNEAHFEGNVTAYNYKTVTVTDSSGKQTTEKVLDTDNAKTQTLYIDSDIKSVKNDSRLGYLNGPKGQSIVNTQDTRYQNAIHADKETTDAIVKGTIYGTDAILSEELGFAQ